MQSPNNSNRPTMKIKLADNEALRSVLAAFKVRQIIARDKASK